MGNQELQEAVKLLLVANVHYRCGPTSLPVLSHQSVYWAALSLPTHVGEVPTSMMLAAAAAALEQNPSF